MNRLQLFRLLRRNNNLGYRRSPSFEQNMVAKVLMLLGGAFFVLYLIIYSILFSTIAISEHEPSMIMGLMPLMLLIDFGIRFMVQQTPAMLIKPYLLQPLPRRSLIESFLVSSLVSVYNWLWLFFFIPYIIIVLAGDCPWWLGLTLLLSGELLIMVNSQFYLMVRTLVNRNILWWVLPISVYGGYWGVILIENGKYFESMADALVAFSATPWLLLVSGGLLAGLFVINRSMQMRFVMEEISQQTQTASTHVRHISRFAFFDGIGEVGEYLKLELKSIFRNRAVRGRVITSLSLIIVLSGIIAYTDIYDGVMMLNFWCYYCFALYGMMVLVKVMGIEGNYIDLLMVHRENILMLLKAKYYFHCAILVVPFLILLPAVFNGKFSLLMMLAYMSITSGVLYFFLFQLAVYNKQTLPLEQKITGKNKIENGLQLVIEMMGMFLPVAFVPILLLLLPQDTAYIVVIIVGLLFTLTHPLWLLHIYQRMMLRKYENMEGFHASR